MSVSFGLDALGGTGSVGAQASNVLGSSGLAAQAQAAIGGVLGSLGLGSLIGFGRDDPDTPYRFCIEMGSVIQNVRFKEVSGLKISTKVTKVREGGNNLYEVSLIEAAKFEPLVIKKGFYSANCEFFDWVMRVHDPSTPYTRENLDLLVFNDKGIEVCRFTIAKAFIMEYEAPKFDATSKEIAFETMKINYDYFDFTPATGLSKAIGSGLAAMTNMVANAI